MATTSTASTAPYYGTVRIIDLIKAEYETSTATHYLLATTNTTDPARRRTLWYSDRHGKTGPVGTRPTLEALASAIDAAELRDLETAPALLLCIDCGQPVCTKLDIEADQPNGVPIYCCEICREVNRADAAASAETAKRWIDRCLGRSV